MELLSETTGGAYRAPRPLAGVSPEPHPRFQPFGLQALALRASQLRAPNLLLNQGPSEPCYATNGRIEILIKLNMCLMNREHELV